MFGPGAKKLFIQQGYVPETCSMHEDLAAVVIFSEVSAGRDPCAGCNMDREVCKGRPKSNRYAQSHERD